MTSEQVLLLYDALCSSIKSQLIVGANISQMTSQIKRHLSKGIFFFPSSGIFSSFRMARKAVAWGQFVWIYVTLEPKETVIIWK